MGNGTMKAAVWHGEPSLVVQQWEKASIEADEVLVRVAFAGICASDVHILNNGLPRDAVTPPRVIGHECAGTVEAVGAQVKTVAVGDRVAGNPVGACGACYYCHNKMENFCENPFSIIRGPAQGCFAEYVVFKDRQITKLPQGISLKQGALMEPVSIAVHCVDKADVQTGDCCVIIGGGPIGLMIADMARHRGAGKIILSDPNPARRKAAETFGADVVVDPQSEDLLQVVHKHTENRGADICVEAVGVPALIEQCPALVRYGGTVLLVGWPPRDAKVSISPFLFYRYEVQIKGAQLSPYTFDKTARFMERFELDKYISHVYKLDDINEAFDMQRSQQGLRILIDMS